MKKTLIAANWKMHLNVSSASIYLNHLNKEVPVHRNIEVVIAPSLLALQPLSLEADHRKIKLAAQNAYHKDEGAFTGEVSFTMLRGLVKYVIIGHSERRLYFHEDLEMIRDKVENAKQKLANGHILLLENLRFYKGEEDNDENFAQELAKNSEVFVQDAFGVVHRAHASTSAITKFLPSVAGLLLEKEVDSITEAIKNPKRPLATIVGGAKVSDKIDIINEFVEIADFMAIGGAMANNYIFNQIS